MQSRCKQQSGSQQRINGFDRKEGKNIFKQLCRQLWYDGPNKKASLGWRKVSYDPEQLFEDRRALRSTTAMETEILSEILHGPAGKEDAKHVLWLAYPCEWKVRCFARSFFSAATRTI